jgi:hypothetical protein
MKLNIKTYRSFILGKLAESEREELEGRFLEDPEVFDEIEAVEAELVDEWARGELASEDRRKIEKLRALSPRLEERMRVASALAQRSDPLPQPSFAQRYRPWLLAASLTGLALLSWATSSIFIAGDEPTTEVAEVILWGEALRSGSEAEQVTLDASDDYLSVKIDLGSGAPFSKYTISVYGPDGSTIWAPSPLEPEDLSWGLALVDEIPSELLPAASYQVELRGLRGSDRELIGYYSLEVIRDEGSN